MPRRSPRAPRTGARAVPPPRLALVGTAGAILAAALATAFLFLAREPALEIRDGSGRPLAELRVPEGNFSLVFRHSFHLTPVEERFEIEPAGRFRARIRLRELRYQSTGVGMPADAEGGYRLEGGFFVLSMDRVFESIPILVSILPGHGVVIGGEYLPFRNWASPEDGIELRARLVPAPIFPRR